MVWWMLATETALGAATSHSPRARYGLYSMAQILHTIQYVAL